MKRVKKLKQQAAATMTEWPAGCPVEFWLGPKSDPPYSGVVLDVTVAGKVQLAAYVREDHSRKIVLVPMTRLRKVG